jgi:hypothetical protein
MVFLAPVGEAAVISLLDLSGDAVPTLIMLMGEVVKASLLYEVG